MRYPAYPKYKDSGVEWLGDVPEGWRTVPLWSLFWRTKKVGYINEELLSVYRDFGVIPKSSRDDNNNNPSEDLSPYQLVVEGDMVINKMKAWQGSVAVSQYRGIVSPAYFVYTATHKQNSQYLHYLLRTVEYTCAYFSVSKGIRINQWDLDPQYHSRLPILLPSFEEQQTIAAFLDHETAKIDALIQEQEKLVTLLQEKRQAVISHAVTKGLNPDAPMKDSGVEWLGEMPEGWAVFNFRRMITRIEQGWSPNASSEPCQNGEWGVLKISAVKFGHFDQAENKALLDDVLPIEIYRVFPGDLLLTRGNTPDLVGDCCVVSGDLHHNLMMSDLIYRVKICHSSNVHFFSYFLRSSFARAQIKADARGSSMTMAKISQGHIKDWVVIVPSSEEQRAIVDYLDTATTKIDTLITESQRAIELLKERRAAVISAAVTGKIDVRTIPLQEAV